MSQEHDTAAWVVRAIGDGNVDCYLRAIVDAVKARKEVLGESLPDQNPLVTATHVTVADDDLKTLLSNPPIKAKVGTARPAFTAHPKDPRPDPKTPVFTGVFMPTDHPAIPIDLLGYTYDKTQIVGKVVNLNLGAQAHVPVQIVGIGPKSVKVLLVIPPDRNAYHGKKKLYSLWDKNMPLFLDHNVLTPYLGRPIN